MAHPIGRFGGKSREGGKMGKGDWVIRPAGSPGDQEKKRVSRKKREEGNDDFTYKSLPLRNASMYRLPNEFTDNYFIDSGPTSSQISDN
jgi:hypothetical protein